MKKRLLASVLLCSVLTASLAGCGEKPVEPQGGDTAQTTDRSAEKTVVRVQMIGNFTQEDKIDGVTGEQVPGMHVIEEDFEKLHPEIDLQYILMGWDDYQKKTQAMIMADQADVFQLPGIALMADQDVLEPLAPYIERDGFDLGIYLDGQIDGWKVQGSQDSEPQIYALPMLSDSRVICYDKQLFDDWGVPYLPEYPTIEEIADAAKKMTGTNPKTGVQNYGVMWRGSDTDDTVMNLAESYGGTWGSGNRFAELQYNFNSPEMQKAAETLKSLLPYAPEGVMTNAGGENFGRENNDVAINLRAQPEKDICVIRDLGLADRYGTAYLFVNPDTGTGGLFAGSPVGIAKGSKVKDAAWEYLKYTAGETFQQHIMYERQLPCIKGAAKFEGIKGDANMELTLDSIQRLWTPRYPYRAAAPRGILSAAVESVVTGTSDAKTALDGAQADAEKWTSEQ